MAANWLIIFQGGLLLKGCSNMQSYQNVLTELDNGVYIIRNAVPVVFPMARNTGAACTSLDVTPYYLKLIDNLEKAQTRVRNSGVS